jgi:hypothetical protein
MSWTDSILSNTVGVVYRAASGNVDPWTLQAQKDQVAADTKQALGPNASDADVAAAQVNAQNAIDSYLKTVNAHPDQAGIRLPGLGVIGTPEFLAKLEKVVYVLIAGGALVCVFYFSQRYGSILKKTFRKR